MFTDSIYPLRFSAAARSAATAVYFANSSTRLLSEFFEKKGLLALKQEDRLEQWYDDWLSYQASHRIYASVLAPARYSSLGSQFDLLSYSRSLEVIAYYSPAHGYSLQASFLGLFSILMGTNAALKQEAVQSLEKGELIAFGISEKEHGSDLLANEFTLAQVAPGRFVANGKKYYIGNANSAAIISIMARLEGDRSGTGKRPLPALFVMRPAKTAAFCNVNKIHTIGVRAGFVGQFEVVNHELPESDLIAHGRDAWDAVLGAVTLGKFFLGFGSIGICEHALEEASDHLGRRILYGQPVIDMPHIRLAMAQAYARLTAMKLYAYRALDYVHAASATDRRYILYCAVQKAMVSTQGVKVMTQLLDCIGARGFESDTFFEMALRDVQLLPSLEGSTHINLMLAAQFIPNYFSGTQFQGTRPSSLAATRQSSDENEYLMEGRTGALHTIVFGDFLEPYQSLQSVPNVRLFSEQAKAFQSFIQKHLAKDPATTHSSDLIVGQCLAIIVYGQLVAENSVNFNLPMQLVSAIFHLLITDLGTTAMALASSPHFDQSIVQQWIAHALVIPQTSSADWDFVATRVVAA